jgi:FKBP-type peptidyl-prolyl cis-trans isomerase FkpA
MKLKLCSGLVINPVVLLSVIIIISCGPVTVEQNKPRDNRENEALLQANKYLVKKDIDNIKAFCKRHNWNMKETDSGLWYEMIKEGNGKPVLTGMKVTLKYKVELLDGTFCYSSDSSGYKVFNIGSSNVEAGLDEGIRLMKMGSIARLIIPPHLGFGLLGDNNRIPPRSVEVYLVELLNVGNIQRQ